MLVGYLKQNIFGFELMKNKNSTHYQEDFKISLFEHGPKKYIFKVSVDSKCFVSTSGRLFRAQTAKG